MMSISLLLSDGSLGVVTLTPTDYLPKADALPIQLIYIQEFPQGVTDSFKAAAFATYQLLREKGLWQRGSGYAFLCEIKDQENDGLANTMMGASGGLALSLALMVHILKGGADGLSIAATGEIAKIADGTIGPVEALAEKLRGGVVALPPDSRIYYPRDNKLETEVLEAIKAAAESRKIVLIRVRTLEEAARDFLPPRERRKLLWKAIWFCLALFIAYLAYAFVSCPVALHLLERGRYGLAESHLSIATRLFPWKTCLREICEALETPFQTKVRMRYLLQSGMEEQVSLPRTSRELTLSASDSYAFRIRSSEPVYLYVIRIELDGRLHVLFPSSDFCSATNPVERNTSILLPDKGRWFRPGGYQGLIETYFILSRWRCKDLEEAPLLNAGSQSLHVRKQDLELMINQRERGGYGAGVERNVLLNR